MDVATAAAIVDDQFPELAPARFSAFGEGWDNVAWLVNDTFVFRFPRRRAMVPLLEAEIRWLPWLAPRLPLPVPTPAYVGRPEPRWPHPFYGYRRLSGRTADRAAPDEATRARHAAPLGRFLAALHALPRDGGGPPDTLDRADVGKRVGLVRERLPEIADVADAGAVLALAEASLALPAFAGPPRWVHGDLYARHLLVDDDGALCGVIDWGDVHHGDPALDLSIAWSYLPAPARDTFFAAYGAIDAATGGRARFRALHYGVALLWYGRSVGDAAIADAGRRALAGALAAD